MKILLHDRCTGSKKRKPVVNKKTLVCAACNIKPPASRITMVKESDRFISTRRLLSFRYPRQ
jgi:hypothetical protein